MNFNAFTPDPALQPYIEMYWLLNGYLEQKEMIRLMPDGGINLVLNLGEAITSMQLDKKVDHACPYLVGAMTQTDEQLLTGKVNLFGIKFRPGAFPHFYQFESLHIYANQFYEFDKKDFPDIKKTITGFTSYINQFYLDRLSAPRVSILDIVTDIMQHHGMMKTHALAKRHFITERQLERQFNRQIGVSPKEFMNLARFNHAFAKLQSGNQQTLLDIAHEFGYYDHAHLTNDFRRYTGKAPTDFILSDFSKLVASDIL